MNYLSYIQTSALLACVDDDISVNESFTREQFFKENIRKIFCGYLLVEVWNAIVNMG